MKPGRFFAGRQPPPLIPRLPVEQSAAIVAAKAVRKSATKTFLIATAGTLGQPVSFIVTVRAPAAGGSPAGTVNIVDRGAVLQTLTLAPTTSQNAKFAYSDATYTLTQPPGGSAYFFGKHAVKAMFVPSGTFLKSTGGTKFTVSKPVYTPLSDGVEIETIAAGSGPTIQSGQMAEMLYTGYLAKNGHIFDDSINDGGTPFPFTVGAGQVITGFDEGTLGMQAGETRIVYIPLHRRRLRAGRFAAGDSGERPAHFRAYVGIDFLSEALAANAGDDRKECIPPNRRMLLAVLS